MSYLVSFKLRFKDRLKNVDQKEILKAIQSLRKEDTIIEVTRLCRTRLEGTIQKPSYDKINKKPNSRNSFALIKKVKNVADVKETSITIIESKNSGNTNYSFLEEKDPGKIPGGLAHGKSPKEISKKHGVKFESLLSQLKKGIQVELEHTSDKLSAKEIAMDHLFEDPNYYDKLKKIENK